MDSYGGRYQYPSGRRSPTYNPARASLPVSIGHSTAYGGDIHVIPTSRHELPTMTPRGHASNYMPQTTTTYTVRKEHAPARSSSVRDSTSSRHHRSSTLDSSTKRPIIVTTTGAGHHRHHHPSRAEASPTRDPYRSSDEAQYYSAQPATSSRHRPSGRTYRTQPASSTTESDEITRLRERQDALQPRPSDAASRSRAAYTSVPRHGKTSSVDYSDDGYEYTKPSDLARYDLDHDRDQDRYRHHRRRDSMDRSYQRPTVSVSTDIGRPYDSTRRGPPPTSWGLDKYNRNSTAGVYDGPHLRMPVPPAVPLPPPTPVRRVDPLDSGAGSGVERSATSRQRPVSLIQEHQPRTAYHEKYYGGRDDDATPRPHREREREREREPYYDDGIGQRGFGLRLDGPQPEPERSRVIPKERREPKYAHDYDDNIDTKAAETKRRPEEEPDRTRDDRKAKDREVPRDRERERKGHRDPTRRDDETYDLPVKESDRRDEDDHDRHRIRDKVAAGLTAAAGAIGIASATKPSEDKPERDPRDSPPYRSRDEDSERRKDADEIEVAGSRTSRYRSKTSQSIDDRGSRRDDSLPPESRSQEPREPSRKERDAVPPIDSREDERPSDHRDGGSKAADDPVDGSNTPPRRRRRPSTAFKPTDTADLMDLKAKLAAMEVKEKTRDDDPAREPSPGHRRSASPDSLVSRSVSRSRDDSRVRSTNSTPPGEKQVRVVSPPRDREERRPLKGILKQPSSKFPEDANPVREGVAPHKDDKSKQDVPSGARWTKINRKLVNPEALTIGKERFEVRDDFVIVLRVLSKDEIQAYTTATAQLRERRRREHEEKNDREHERDDDDRSRHRHKRDKPRDEDERERERERERDKDYRDRDRNRDEDRHRRPRRHSDDDVDKSTATEYPYERSHRHRKRDSMIDAP